MEIGQFKVLFLGEADGKVQLKDHIWPLFQQAPKGLKSTCFLLVDLPQILNS